MLPVVLLKTFSALILPSMSRWVSGWSSRPIASASSGLPVRGGFSRPSFLPSAAKASCTWGTSMASLLAASARAPDSLSRRSDSVVATSASLRTPSASSALRPPPARISSWMTDSTTRRCSADFW